MKKSVVAGLGEIGTPVLKLLSKKNTVVGFDIKSDLANTVLYHHFDHVLLDSMYTSSTFGL